jgi:glycosyltransferase involved in cell wall biosynthesis
MKSIEESDKIIAVSEYTKDDLINTLSVEKDKVIVANNAINSEDFKNITQSSVKSTLNKFKVEGKFLLFVGTLEPRKNIKNIILAFEKLADPTITLVLAGKIGWLPKNELEYLNKITNKNSKVVVTGYISDDDLRCLYIGAEMLLFPSNFEGFGLPILEAMASGTPVITSNLRPMNEIAGNAAILVKPDDILEISQSIKRILTDTTLSNQLIRRGYKNVEKYNWEKSADVFKQVIKDLR